MARSRQSRSDSAWPSALRQALRNPGFWLGAIVGLGLDRWSKYWVMARFELGESWSLWPGVFHFTYVENPGAAFSLFSQAGGWLRWLSLGVSLGLALWAWLGPRLGRWEQWGFGFIFAGAFGNGIDRFAAGKVVDFLDFRLINFPIFNLADVFINLGLACLLLGVFLDGRAEHGRAEHGRAENGRAGTGSGEPRDRKRR